MRSKVGVDLFLGKNILITGGTGSIGKELIKQILAFNPAVIRVLSRDEHKQFELQEELFIHENIRFLLGDVRHKERLVYAMKGIDYVFHLAALKQVPACEYNPFEAVQTNVLGSQNIIEAAMENNVKKVLFTSSDKAINPTNIMGASKLIAERLFVSADLYKGAHSTIFTAVRFGNVIGSRGSVIPLFFNQILKGKKITVTNPNMYRFMMSLSEACKLMLDSMINAEGGEIFVLKMPVLRLGDLVEAMLEIAEEKLGMKKKEIIIEEIGLRQGEKMFEELLLEEEIGSVEESKDMYVISGSKNKEKTNVAIPTGRYRADDPSCTRLSVGEIKQMILKELQLDGVKY